MKEASGCWVSAYLPAQYKQRMRDGVNFKGGARSNKIKQDRPSVKTGICMRWGKEKRVGDGKKKASESWNLARPVDKKGSREALEGMTQRQARPGVFLFGKPREKPRNRREEGLEWAQQQSDTFKQPTAEETASLREEQRNIAIVQIWHDLRRKLTRKDRNNNTTQHWRRT